MIWSAAPTTRLSKNSSALRPCRAGVIYFDASPISYATVDRNQVRFLLIHGTDDDIVDPPSQSGAFLTALTQARFFVRRIVFPGAGHFWSADPFESEPQSYSALAIPRLLRFLETSL